MATKKRMIHVIADDIRDKWKNIYFAAVPYLLAMEELCEVTDIYGVETAKGIILGFLSNASYWRGEDARRIKKELQTLIK